MSRPSLNIVLILSLAAACQGKASAEALEAELITWFANQGLTASEATCPDKQKLEGGNEFECTVMIDGVEIPIQVEVTNPSAGVVSWRPKYKTFTREHVENSIRALPEFKDRELTLDCHATVFVSVPNTTIVCDVSDSSNAQAYLATLEFTDAEGSGLWQVASK
jgi:hypothetical protein